MDGNSIGCDPQDIECPGNPDLPADAHCDGFVEVSGAQSDAPLCARCQFRRNFPEGRDPLSAALVEEQAAHLRTAVVANAALRRMKPLADFGAKSKLHLNEGPAKRHKEKLEMIKEIQAYIDSSKWDPGKTDSGPIVQGKKRRTICKESKRKAIIKAIASRFDLSRSYVYALENKKGGITFPGDAKKRRRLSP